MADADLGGPSTLNFKLVDQREHTRTQAHRAAAPLIPTRSDPGLAIAGSTSEVLSLPEAVAVDFAETAHVDDKDEGVLAATQTRRGRSSAAALAGGDALALASGAVGAVLLRQSEAATPSLPGEIAFVAAFVLLGLGLFAGYGSYHARTRPQLGSGWSDLRVVVPGLALLGWVLVGALMLLGLRRSGSIDELTVGLSVLLCAAAVPIGRLANRTVQRRLRAPRRIVVVGSGLVARNVARSLAWDGGVEVLGLVDDDPQHGDVVLGGTADLPALCEQLEVDQVVVAFSRTHPATALERLRCVQPSVDVAIVPRYFELLSPRVSLREFWGVPLIDLAPPQLGLGARLAKRVFDIVVATGMILLLSPVMATVALVIKFTSSGPILFRQERTGRGGQAFVMYKFRSMTTSGGEVPATLRATSEVDGPLFKMREDPRITPAGRFLRRTSLDELPQLFNVLTGQMSLVGPRPFIPAESSQMTGLAMRRFEVKPGLTGLWQVSGRSMLSYDEVVRLDYLYVASWSFWWDVKILLSTPSKVLARVGAF